MSRKNNRIVHSPTVERLLLEIEGQAVKSQPKSLVQPRNYTKENIKRLKEIQEKCKKREVNSSTPTKALPLKPIYNGKNQVNKPNINGNLDSRNVLYRSKKPEPCSDMSIESYRFDGLRKSSSQQNLNESQPSRPTSSSIKKSPSLTDLKSHKKESPKVTPSLPHSLGTVPKYLLRRKQQWKEEEKKREAMNRDATIPPGHTLMSDDERIETLQLLKKTQNALLQQLVALPVQIDTLRAKQRKEEIENQLKKAEEGINIFSRSRVLIKNDC